MENQLAIKTSTQIKNIPDQGYNARKVNFRFVYVAYILKPVISGRNL